MSASSSWGPFAAGIDYAERLARFRSLRVALRLLTGERGRDAGFAVLRAEISGDDPDLLAAAEAEFGRLAPLDRRRVLSSFASVNFEKVRQHG